jgi:uncharacterized protein YukE
MKFAMGADVLGSLAKKTSTASDDLGATVKQLAAVTEKLEGKVNGATRAAFDNFQAHATDIAAELTMALRGVLAGVSAMDKSFAEGDQEMADQTRQAQGSVSFDAARFGTTKA